MLKLIHHPEVVMDSTCSSHLLPQLMCSGFLDLVPISHSAKQSTFCNTTCLGDEGGEICWSFLSEMFEKVNFYQKKKKPNPKLKTGNSYQLARKLYCFVEVLPYGHCYFQ